jgi:hypothetical protein
MRPKGERIGEIAAKEAVQLLFSTGKSFKVDGLREKLREFLQAGGTTRTFDSERLRSLVGNLRLHS